MGWELWNFPRAMKKKEMEDYLQITEHNWNDIKKIGRVYYMIDTLGSIPHLLAIGCIYPCMRPNSTMVVKGDFSVPVPNYSIRCFDGQNYDEWASGYKGVFDMAIKRKILFVNKKLKPATFEWK